jgi:hypothetical protein
MQVLAQGYDGIEDAYGTREAWVSQAWRRLVSDQDKAKEDLTLEQPKVLMAAAAV